MSQDNTEYTKIGEHEYAMSMLPPVPSNDLLIDVSKMIGPSIGPVIDALFSGNSSDEENVLEQEISKDFFSRASKTFFGDLDKKVLNNVISTFKQYTEVDNKPLAAIFDLHFRGNLDSMHRWVLWGMQVQWGKSLSALVKEAVTKAAALKAQSQSTSPST